MPEHHCTLSFDIMQQKIVLNLESSTGEISVNDVRATESCYLNHKDKIQIGGSVYMLIELCRDGFSWWNTLPVQDQKRRIRLMISILLFGRTAHRYEFKYGGYSG